MRMKSRLRGVRSAVEEARKGCREVYRDDASRARACDLGVKLVWDTLTSSGKEPYSLSGRRRGKK